MITKNSVFDEIRNAHPDAQFIDNGVLAFTSDELNEETGMFKTIKVSVSCSDIDLAEAAAAYVQKRTEVEARKAERAAHAAAKKEEDAAKKEAAAARREALAKAVTEFVMAGCEGLTAKEIATAVSTESTTYLPMHVSGALKTLVEDGTLTVEIDENGRKHYSRS